MIPVDRIRVSSQNIRANEPFGDEEDQGLVESIGTFGILEPIIVRPVGDMYELYSGRRRFLSAKESGLTEIPCIIKDVDDEEALDISLIENIQRKDVNPVTIGRILKQRIDKSGIRPSDYARFLGISRQKLNYWLRILDLSPAMQREVQFGTVSLRDALKVVRMNLPPEVEDTLAEEVRVEGLETFKRSLDRIAADQEKRGAPKGLLITRINWGLESPEYEELKRRAEEAGIELSEYCQKVLVDHIKEF